MLRVGDQVPEFTLETDGGSKVSSTGMLGKRYVLYFYPRDDTSGCTIEACNFRDNLPNFSQVNVPVFGISPDDVKSHVKFKTKFALNFPLLADPDHEVAQAFGAWVKKSNYGREYMGVQRSTFIIARNGQVEEVWEKVNPAGHAEEILKWLSSSQAEDREDEMEYRPPAEVPSAPAEPKAETAKSAAEVFEAAAMKAAPKTAKAAKAAKGAKTAKKTSAKKASAMSSKPTKSTKSTAKKSVAKKPSAKKSAAKSK